MTTPNFFLSPGLNCNNFVLQVGRTVSQSHYYTLGVHLPLSSSPPTNPRPIKPLLWESRICHAVVMSRVGVSCIVDVYPRVFLTLWLYAQRILQESNTRGRGRTQKSAPPATTSTTQVKASSSRNNRLAATTSTVPRARSGWSGFSDFTIRLPGPLGSVLGRY
ncbi:hypothetical protein EDB87DRAFT_160361 [Lactarius vividus]|nr:hypothetical protein EDB87DRAFT_160361 [Lactarius vividus]